MLISAIAWNDIFKGTIGSAASLRDCVITLIVAIILGAIISYTYRKTSNSMSGGQGSITLALVMLPSIISTIVFLVGSNLASALSLGGAFALVRFRSLPGEPRDISFICLTMATGLGLGRNLIDDNLLVYTVIFTVVLCAGFFLFTLLGFDKNVQKIQLLKITVPENLPFDNNFEEVMKKYSIKYTMDKVQMSNLGSLFDIYYSVRMNRDTDIKAFIDELRLYNGNLNINLNYKPVPKVR